MNTKDELLVLKEALSMARNQNSVVFEKKDSDSFIKTMVQFMNLPEVDYSDLQALSDSEAISVSQQRR